MNLLTYLNSKVYVSLTNGFYYTGKVIDATTDSLTLIDKNGLKVSLARSSIARITELI